MKLKSINRLFVIGTTLLAVLFFFGVRGRHSVGTKNSFTSFIQKEELLTPTAPLPPPVEIEIKEEQPQTEDDEVDCGGGLVGHVNTFNLIDLRIFASRSFNAVFTTKSLTEYHTPAYVRLRSILI